MRDHADRRPRLRTGRYGLPLIVVAISFGAKCNCPPCKPGQPCEESGSGNGWTQVANAIESSKPENHPWKNRINQEGKPLRGFVDLHAHPMAHLGFGGKVIHGAPDDKSLMLAGTIGCGIDKRRANGIAEALGSCYPSHGGKDFIKNDCGNWVRKEVLAGVQGAYHHAHPAAEHPRGYPTFVDWPRYNDVLHQSMYHAWIRRAYDGGLRVLVALAVNNRTLATGIDANEPRDDVGAADLQIAEMREFVKEHSAFLEIAESAADLRRIVGRDDKLAIILGIEIDDFGNWNKDGKGQGVTFAEVWADEEVERLHALGVRYVLPVHMTDNLLGGAAVYDYVQTVANRFQTGSWFQLECAPLSEGINRKLEGPEKEGVHLAQTTLLGFPGQKQPVPTCSRGHQNRQGLTPIGRLVIDALVKRGMIIDVDHMSNRTLKDVLAYTNDDKYPLVAGHNGIRYKHDPASTERSITSEHIQELAARKGMVGVGMAETTADRFALTAYSVAQHHGVGVAVGTDANGVSPLAAPRAPCKTNPSAAGCVRYSSAFPKSRLASRTWDYNTEGMAHYGLLPDFLRDVAAQPTYGLDAAFHLLMGPEAFASMWERAEAIGATRR